MSTDENVRFWLERLRKEVAAIRNREQHLVLAIGLAETELLHGLEDAARATLLGCAGRLGQIQPGVWHPIVRRVAELCGVFSENRLLRPEVERGVAWLAVPKIVKYQDGLRECVHDLAIQTAQADVAAELVSNEWPDVRANRLVDACRLAAWAGDAAGVQRGLPVATKAIAAAEPGTDYRRCVVVGWLIDACLRVGLLANAAELCEEIGLENADRLVIALSAGGDRDLYAVVRDRWIAACTKAYRSESWDYSHSWNLRSCAETLHRLGDDAGYRSAIRQFREAAAAWTPTHDTFACGVYGDLAVLSSKADEVQLAAEYLSTAMRLYEGREPDVSSARGSRSMIASILSAAYRDIGDVDLALRFARKISDKRGRQTHLVSALILGRRVSAAELELAKLDSAEERAGLIHYSLTTEYPYGFSPSLLVRQHERPLPI